MRRGERGVRERGRGKEAKKRSKGEGSERQGKGKGVRKRGGKGRREEGKQSAT